jgi:hypothetical protein
MGPRLHTTGRRRFATQRIVRPDLLLVWQEHLAPTCERRAMREYDHWLLDVDLLCQPRECPTNCVGIRSRKEIDVEHNHNQVG